MTQTTTNSPTTLPGPELARLDEVWPLDAEGDEDEVLLLEVPEAVGAGLLALLELLTD